MFGKELQPQYADLWNFSIMCTSAIVATADLPERGAVLSLSRGVFLCTLFHLSLLYYDAGVYSIKFAFLVK